MAGEAMVAAEPTWLDSVVLTPRAPEPHGIGCGPLPTILVEHVRLGRCRINLKDYDPSIHGPLADRAVR